MPRAKLSMMGAYNAEEIEEEARMWCQKHGIRIYPVPETRGAPAAWFLIIEINNNKNKAPEPLKRNVVWKQMYTYYMYYYKKHLDEQKRNRV
tara:strand:+ start:31 stop:306 length:276 start_codon:yes stop_codon:yes gene_type:complete